MEVKKEVFGTLSDGNVASLYTVSNGKMSFSATDYGCIITSILLPDPRSGKVDVSLGYSTLTGYACGTSSFGAIVGRFANRIGNAKFSLDGKDYALDVNSCGADCLHGGYTRYDKMLWKSSVFSNKNGIGVKFTRTSRDMEQGFPGNVKLEVVYTLDKFNRITLKYKASSDAATPINITNHTYFNLAGRGSVEDHVLQMNCPSYLEVDKNLIPTGKLIRVNGSAFDFLKSKKLGKDIKKTGNGYDHCFVTEVYDPDMKSAFDGEVKYAATIEDPVSGRAMKVYTDQIGIQLYTGNFLNGETGRNGMKYGKHEAFCLETQCFPDTPNKKDFPSCILYPGKKYKALTVYEFLF
ncbi:galactose mutarotase [Treponema parvum]|uniref:Aldose 1-epimerase n=1 Tax=Treponema parvum TaxID=138851 RepID=A0A975F4V2_9SPIR|nr:aldose epimerase family protein [Treponema parvum]QTQ14094.1 galactose mutarotase [Treponema parvum]